MEWPLWLFEAQVYGYAAFIFCAVTWPLMYYLAWRRCSSRYKDQGFIIGNNFAWNRLERYLGALTFTELSDAVRERGMSWGKGKPCLEFDCIEFAGEAGELCDAIKKHLRHAMGMAGGVESIEPIEEELGDVMICATILANNFGIDLGKATARKFNLTSHKYGLKEKIREVA